MSAVQAIRKRLGYTQAALAAKLGVSQGSVSFYENGTTKIQPDVAGKLIDVAGQHGLSISFDHVYGAATLPPERKRASKAAA